MTKCNQPKINTEQKLYLFWHGEGFSCLGFENARKQAEAVAQWIGEPIPDPSIWGQLAGYDELQRLMKLGQEYSEKTKTRCPAELTPQLIGLEGKLVEVIDCYGETRRFYVGKSTGWMPCHLEIEQRTHSGGGAVSGTPFRSVREISGTPNKPRY